MLGKHEALRNLALQLEFTVSDLFETMVDLCFFTDVIIQFRVAYFVYGACARSACACAPWVRQQKVVTAAWAAANTTCGTLMCATRSGRNGESLSVCCEVSPVCIRVSGPRWMRYRQSGQWRRRWGLRSPNTRRASRRMGGPGPDSANRRARTLDVKGGVV